MAWPDVDSAGLAVRRMQRKLHRWASEDPARRFDDLFNLVYDPAFLVDAFTRVAGNKGAKTAGVDGLTVAAVDTRIGVDVFLGQIRDSLKTREYRPCPVRQVMIPKGGGKLRRLGIPTVADRVVQAVVKAVLEPIFEADFLPCSYGFRPNRRAQDAIAEIHHFTSAPINYEWVLEADIAACFDEIDHVAVMDRLRRRIKDKRLANLVKAFLKSGIFTDLGDREESPTGTPQGGILSPLLANIALSVLDEHFTQHWDPATGAMGTPARRAARKRNGKGNWRLIRYADDFVLLVSGDRHHAEALRVEVAAVLAPLGLRLAEEKTRAVHIDEGFDFLGFHIRRMRKRGTQKRYVYTTPSRKSTQKVRDRVREKTNKSNLNTDLDELLSGLNQTVRGWANYFRHGVSKATFSAVDHHTWWRLVGWIRRKHPKISWKEIRRRFCDHGWRIAHNGVVFTGASSVAVTRYRYRGANIPTPWTPALTG
ncbi:group II intron reverse transcriptase/maturase [Pseudonocardia kunmingensis]|uniref:group II intron reverse transcriptase/maturase n=1 Tax=Pseudonocardia kunmingensis TaxID=630975 RepID=UPI001B882A8C|nr:group II intron reverse transcriptase/maturase [Pseudonocardia kunmingensis]